MLDRRLRAAPFHRSAVGCDRNGHRLVSIGACAFEKSRRTFFRATAARNACCARIVAAASDSELMTNRASDVLSTAILFRAGNMASVLQDKWSARLTGTAPRPAVIDGVASRWIQG